jgi:cation/acetate symporter
MMGIFSKTVSDKGASAGMLAGLIVTLFYVFAHKGIFFVKGTEYLDLIGGANSFFTITPEAFGTVGAIVNFVVAYLVSKMGAPVPQHIQALVESVRVPKGAGAASAGH